MPFLRQKTCGVLERLLGWTDQPCHLCGAHQRAPVCPSCSSELARPLNTCPRCAIPMAAPGDCGPCTLQPPAFDATRAAWLYVPPLDRLVHGLKYHGRLPLAAWFGEALSKDLPSVDFICPMPLHPTRLRERGFNQAHEIARIVSGRTGIPLMKRTVRRIRPTLEQSLLDRRARRANVRGAFHCAEPMDGATILVIDDVMTTGATLEQVAQALRLAGAAQVINRVVARANLHGEE